MRSAPTLIARSFEQEREIPEARVVALLTDQSIISVGSAEPIKQSSPEAKRDPNDGHKKS